MSDQGKPYIQRHPGDLLTSNDWNALQIEIQQDIAKQVAAAISKVTSVDQAKNSHMLDNMTVDQLSQQILQEALAKIPHKTNYRMIFKRLESPSLNANKVKLSEIRHELKACPLVDVYQLDYFHVLCCSGDDLDDPNELYSSWVNFYLYHSSEKRLRIKGTTTTPAATFDIEPVGQQAYKIPFREMLELFKGRDGFTWDDDTTLDELETDFWKAFFDSPNDEFEEDQYCHSPWFEKCCGEQRTVGDLHKRGDWDNIWFQMRPEKTINYPAPSTEQGKFSSPTNIQVVHYDFNTLGIGLLEDPVYQNAKDLDADDPSATKSKLLNAMLLLKV